MSISGKPDNPGGPMHGCTYTWKPVSAGGLIVRRREARQSGRPGEKDNVRDMEGGPCRRPCHPQVEAGQCGRPYVWINTYMEAGLCRRPDSV